GSPAPKAACQRVTGESATAPTPNEKTAETPSRSARRRLSRVWERLFMAVALRKTRALPRSPRGSSGRGNQDVERETRSRWHDGVILDGEWRSRGWSGSLLDKSP